MNTAPIFPFSTYLYALLDVRGREMNCRLRHFPVYDQRGLWLDENIFFYARKCFWRVFWAEECLFCESGIIFVFLFSFLKIQTNIYFSTCIEINMLRLKVNEM